LVPDQDAAGSNPVAPVPSNLTPRLTVIALGQRFCKAMGAMVSLALNIRDIGAW
jgi:hypothetical protein